ncbi:MAG: non-canonical purine NTP pyrophosphatase [Verrucomicrobia bacterium]|nr:non-canonical purine NTP pyrophosphatase [Verrucomicrobiota bacterium]
MNLQLIVATSNQHKVQEIASFLGSEARCRAMSDLGHPPSVLEDADTFRGNAVKKCLSLANYLRTNTELWTGLFERGEIGVLADDSGLEVDVLGGAPGIHSARFAHMDAAGQRGNAPDQANNEKLLGLMTGIPEERRGAQFRCVLALAWLGEGLVVAEPLVFEGICRGRILPGCVGKGGFGYDPLFVPVGFDRTFSELGSDVKNTLSHRAKALSGLREHLRLRSRTRTC